MKTKDHKIWTSPDPKVINKMINLLLKMMFRNIFLRMVKYIPWTQGMCNEVVYIEPRPLAFIPNHFKKEEMCINRQGFFPNNLTNLGTKLFSTESCKVYNLN